MIMIAVVGFAGDHLKDRKVTEFNTLDNFYLKIWDFWSRFQSKLFLKSLCEVSVKNLERHWVIQFLKG